MVETSVENRLFGVELRALFQAADAQVVTVDNASRLVSLPSREYGKQGRLARSVLRYQSNVLSFCNGEGYFVEQDLRSETFRQLLNV